MRPTYETERDRQLERITIEVAAKRWQVTAVKLPQFDEVDYALVRGGRVVGVAEVKTRSNQHDTYQTYMISLRKVMRGAALELSAGLRFVLVVGFTDGVWYCRPSKEQDCNVSIGGRKDRGDEQDVEMVLHIPISAFRRVADAATA